MKTPPAIDEATGIADVGHAEGDGPCEKCGRDVGEGAAKITYQGLPADWDAEKVERLRTARICTKCLNGLCDRTEKRRNFSLREEINAEPRT